MTLQHVGYIDLPPHTKNSGFDHAAVHTGHHLCYVAHTANDAVDVIDCLEDRYLRSIPNLTGVAGALVSEADDLVFTSNRGENTVSIFSGKDAKDLGKISVGIRQMDCHTTHNLACCCLHTSAIPISLTQRPYQ